LDTLESEVNCEPNLQIFDRQRPLRVHVGQDLSPGLLGSTIRRHIITIRSEPNVDDPLFRWTTRGRSDGIDIVRRRVGGPTSRGVLSPDTG